MRIPGNQISDIKRYFQSELGHLYSPNELLVLFRLATQHINQLSPIDLHFGADQRVLESELLQYSWFVKRLKKQEPVQYIMGYTWFMDLKIQVGPEVLIPRPETEELVNLILSSWDGPKQVQILDACTGSGCIALAVKHYWPEATVSANDVSPLALELARKNAAALQLDVNFFSEDVLQASSPVNSIDILVSNPPYIALSESDSISASVKEYEPHIALFVNHHDTFLFYRKLSHYGWNALRPNGIIAFECHYQGTAQVCEILTQQGFVQVQEHLDLSNNPRMVSARKPQ